MRQTPSTANIWNERDGAWAHWQAQEMFLGTLGRHHARGITVAPTCGPYKRARVHEQALKGVKLILHEPTIHMG